MSISSRCLLHCFFPGSEGGQQEEKELSHRSNMVQTHTLDDLLLFFSNGQQVRNRMKQVSDTPEKACWLL